MPYVRDKNGAYHTVLAVMAHTKDTDVAWSQTNLIRVIRRGDGGGNKKRGGEHEMSEETVVQYLHNKDSPPPNNNGWRGPMLHRLPLRD